MKAEYASRNNDQISIFTQPHNHHILSLNIYSIKGERFVSMLEYHFRLIESEKLTNTYFL